ncbi:MAG: hypothetical protein AVDCRST_MAG70-777 [uncultured Thermomicrobiales bacterium]|uniref:DoxX family protein n=1 Tax=uncultured Thermomicrobiales bacterium TaxID=1645740 RepID=A0A6J4UF96_9BACT|nr:MAG: hypothetical protein AVDCRST_MAG70-777 [uncultured Thermomicrobiales bacterium]
MTRSRTYAITAIAAVLYVFLCWVFADGLLSGNWWNSDDIAGSTILTYVLLAAIIGAGVIQARRLPESGVPVQRDEPSIRAGQVDDPVFWKLLLGNVYYSILWLPVRFFVGQEWLAAGEHKLRDSAWMDGGTALVAPGEALGFWERIVIIPEQGRPAITYGWYRDLLQYMIDNEWQSGFAKLIAIGEFLIGLGLIVGALVGIAAFFGTVLNFNFLLAGTASTNPVLFGLSVFLILAWKVAGHWGLDRWVLPALGTPWKPLPLLRAHTPRVDHGLT